MPELGNLPYGGLALIEGIMMRSPNFFSIACRAPNGKIVVHTEHYEKTWIGRQKWLKLPFLRGSLAILDSMALGIRATRFSTEVQVDEKFQPTVISMPQAGGEDPSEALAVPAAPVAVAAPLTEQQKLKEKRVQDMQVMGAMVFGLVFGVVLFNIVPQAIAQWTGLSAGDKKGTATNFIAEIVKIVILIGYLFLISKLEAIQETFRYHGAEHKAINNLESGDELTVEHTRKLTRLHPRCGTSFMVIVFLIGLVLLPFVPRYPITGEPGRWYLDVTARVALEVFIIVPIIAGISYELLRLAGKFRNQKWVEIAFAPGLASQKYLTTVEPQDKHIEVALAALKAVVLAEQKGELTESEDYDSAPITGLAPVLAPST